MTFSDRLGQLPLNEQHTVNVQPLPWIAYFTPKAGSLYTGTTPAMVQRIIGAAQVNVAQASKQLQVVSHLITSIGQEVDTAVMQPVASGVFSGTLFADVAGLFTARIGLTYNTEGGDKYQENDGVNVEMQRGVVAPQSTPAPTSVVDTPVAPTVITVEAVQLLLTSVEPMSLDNVASALAGTLLFVLLVMLFQLFVLGRIRKSAGQSFAVQNKPLNMWRLHEIGAQLATVVSWKTTVDQIVTDAVKVAISIDGHAGILDISTEPSPKFTVLTRDGRQVVFTTNPQAMKKMRLIQRGDKVVDLSQRSSTAHTERGLLWLYAQEKRHVSHLAAPVNARWYVIVRAADANVLTTKKGLLRPSSVPYIEQSPQPPAMGDKA